MKRGQKVVADDRNAADGTGFDSGASHNKWNSHAAFIQTVLGAGQGDVCGRS